MNNNSRQAKGRYLQNIVKDKIIKLFNLPPGSIRTSNTGENGEDVKLLSLREPALAIISLDHFFDLIEKDD